MSVVQRARARYYETSGYLLSSLNIFDVQQAKRTHSLQYLEQVTNLCQKIRITPEQFSKQTPLIKLKLIKTFQYSTFYSKNLKSLYDSKQQELYEKKRKLLQSIKQKKEAIKAHKQRVDRRKAQYRQIKLNQAKNVYHTFSNQISNLKSKQQELNAIKMQLENDILLAKNQLNYHPSPLYIYPQQQVPSTPSFNQGFHFHPSQHSQANNFNNQNHQQNGYNLNSPLSNNQNLGFKTFQNQNKKTNSKHKNQDSTFSLNQESHEKESKKEKFDQKSMKIDINKNQKSSENFTKQNDELYSPTINLVLKDEDSSFDDLNTHLLSQNINSNQKKSIISNKQSLFDSKEEKSQSSLKKDDSFFQKKLTLESKVSKKSNTKSYDEYELQDEIKQTPNLHYSIESDNKKTDLSYSKMGDSSEVDLWKSTNGSGQKGEQNIKMFNFQPQKKLQSDVKNSVESIKQDQIEESPKKLQKINIENADSQNQFDDIDDLDLGMDTRMSIKNNKREQNVIPQKDTLKKPQTGKLKRSMLEASINKLQSVLQQPQSDITKKNFITSPPALDKQGKKTVEKQKQQDYEQDYDQQFEDQFQQSRRENIEDKKKQTNDHKSDITNNKNKSQVEIILPSNKSLIDGTLTSVDQKIFNYDLVNQTFQPISKEVQNEKSTKGIFPDLQEFTNTLGLEQQDKINQTNEQYDTINTEQLLDDVFDFPQKTTIGKKPKPKTKNDRAQQKQKQKQKTKYLNVSNKLLQFSDNQLIESITTQKRVKTEIVQSTTFDNNNKNPSSFESNQNLSKRQKQLLDSVSITESKHLKNTIQQQKNSKQIIQENEDSVEQEIQYQFEDCSKINQTQKQELQKKIVSIIRYKNKPKPNYSTETTANLFTQIQKQIQKEIKQNLKQSKSKVKQNDWIQIKKIFQQKINKIKGQSSSQVQKRIQEIEKNIFDPQNNHSKKGKLKQEEEKSSNKNSKITKNNDVQESEDNFELNYSQSLLKEQLKSQIKNKKKFQLSDVVSVNEGITNNSQTNQDNDLGFSLLKQNSVVGINVLKEQKVSDESSKFKKQEEQKIESKRQNKLMGAKQQLKAYQTDSRSKYVKSTTSTNKSVAKQSAMTKIQQNKYVSIQDPLNNQIALKQPVLQKKVLSDDDDDF